HAFAQPLAFVCLEQELAVAATLRRAATGTAAASATTAATALSLTACGTIAALRCTLACDCGNGFAFGLVGLFSIQLVLDFDIFFVFVEVGSALEGNGVLGGGTLGALGTRRTLGPFTPLATVLTLSAVAAILTLPTLAAAFTSAAAGAFRNLRQAQLGALLAKHCLAGELDAVAFNGEDLDEDLIALAEFVLDILDAVLGDLGDVEQAVGAGEDLDEGAELGQADHLAEVGLADLGHRGEVADHLDGLGETLGVGGGDVHAAGVVD